MGAKTTVGQTGLEDSAFSQQDPTTPISAFTVGAGAATNSALQQLIQAYYMLRSGVADKWEEPGAGDKYRDQIKAIRQQAADEVELYRSLKKEHPFATVAGEAMPAFAGGVRNGLSALKFNAGTEGAAQALESVAAKQQVPSIPIQKLISGLRSF